MGFKFSYLCDLLSGLEYNRIKKASTFSKNKNPDIQTVINWINHHRKRIYDGETDHLALLSCLFPEKRPDRVYGLQEPSLVKIIGRCLLLGASRKRDLDGWKASGGGDLGQCVEIVMRHSENLIVQGAEVTIEEIDAALNKIASRCRFSGLKIRQNYNAADVDEALKPLFRRLPSRDAKWLTRMILKNYNPVVLPINCVFRNFHFLLPTLLLFQDSLEGAIQFLNSDPIKSFPPRPDPPYDKTLRSTAMNFLTPQTGIKIGRTGFDKARSIKHCCRLAERRKMALERKYDGEYCQVHIDLDRGQDCIQIFSKSGKDSTNDKLGIHKALKQSLRIGQMGCTFSKQCILEGELLVWNNKQEKILEFHKLRKHISRAGKFIGTENDSPPQDYENLMIVFFDILLRDDNRCLVKPYNERRKLLKETVKTIAGQAEIAERKYINFASLDADQRLTRAFAKAITERWEGFVLKDWDDPYISVLASSYRRRWIKLKKDYITGLGDTADFAIIGARYDAVDAHKLGGMKPLLWTSFHVGCLENKRAVVDVNARPEFRVVDVLNHHNLNIRDMRALNQYGQFQNCDIESGTVPFRIKIDQDGLRDAEVLFKTPFVVETYGSGFDKPQNVNYFQLRFPRVLKIHFDRKFEDATTFEELQQMAEDVRSAREEEDILQEFAAWVKKLEMANGKSEYIMDSSQRSTASTASSSPTRRSLSPETNYRQELLPSHSSQAEIGLRIKSRQEKRKVHELNLDDNKRKATSLDVNCDEALPLKRAKRKNYKSSNVAIFTDNSQSATPDTVSTQESRSCLTDVVNLGSQQKPQRETHIVTSAKPTQEDPNSENTPRTGQYLKMNIEEHQSVNHQNTSALENTSTSERTDTSQKQSSHVCTTVSKKVDVTVAREAPTSSKQVSPLDKHVSPFPMLVGRFFKHSSHPFQSVLTDVPVFVTFINPFLDSVFSKWKEDNISSPPGDKQHPAIGIVFVDYSETSAMDTGADIDDIGKRLAELRKQDTNETSTGNGHSQETLQSIFPEKGKIFFLHWGALSRDPSDILSCRKFRWDKVAKSNFAGSVIWGYGRPRGYAVSEEPGDSCHHRAKRRRTSLDEKEGEFGFGRDVWASLDWREVLCLCGYEMEF